MVTDRIKQAKYEEDYQIIILFQNGNEVIFNMKPKLVTARFHDLEDWDLFCRGKVSKCGKIIKWNDNTELSVEEIMLQVKNALL